ncbi:MAG: MBL fold hydrolase [Candidatus Firestonebacteria bacterium RIFOXYA2_FULL_40_8]|nr:MAG: MBL fold hydrolase [Candidatus Firestonebacteria bacterium RIFOXYA2_FULL_40_8]
MSVTVQFLGAARTVTGSKYLLTGEKGKIFVDFGMFRGEENLTQKNYEEFDFNPAEVQYVILTHAHIDHSGLIPRLVNKGFRGKILCTKPTLDLCRIMFLDAAHVESIEIEWRNRKRQRAGKALLQPVYNAQDAAFCMQYFEAVEYNKLKDLKNGFKVRFDDAGHILGSSIVELFTKIDNKEKKLVFSGDLGNEMQDIIRDPEKLESADYLFIESTYGDRLHKGRKETLKEFESAIMNANKDKGNIIIPAFAVERTQEIISELSQMYKKSKLDGFSVYVDSPLAIAATEIFQANSRYFNDKTRLEVEKGINPFSFPSLVYCKRMEDSRALNDLKSNAIIVSASGMCEAGRIKHHLKHNLWREECAIIFTGYQAIGTTGRAIVEGVKAVKIFGEEIAVRAKIFTLGGFSGHADQKGLLKWLSFFKTKKMQVFVVHGEEKGALAFADVIRQRKHYTVTVPELGQKVKL